MLADVQELNPAVNALYYDIQVPLWAMGRMDPKGKTCIDLCTALNDAINLWICAKSRPRPFMLL